MRGSLIRFARKEYELLEYLLAHQGRALPRPRILASVWGDEDHYGLRTVDVYIRRLRVKLAQSDSCHIDTVFNVGYKLVLSPTSTIAG
jgi:DNA-binding response OmpR family regulator